MDSSPAIRDGLNCLCGIASVLDIKSDNKYLEGFHGICNILTTAQESCKSTVKGLAYGATTVVECLSGTIDEAGAEIGDITGSLAGGNNRKL